MAVVIELPHVGESVVEGVIGKWLAQPGDKLRRFDPLVEVVTDKVTMEVPSPYDGVLTSLLAQEGDTVPMGAPIAEMETADTNGSVVQSSHAATPPVQASAPTPPSTIGYLSKDLRPVGPTGGIMAGPETALPDAGPQPDTEPDEPASRRRYSPAVRRLAREQNIDPDTLSGSGMGGRVTREDVMKAVQIRGSAVATAPAPPLAAPAAPASPAPTPTPMTAGADEESVPLTAVRRIIAEHMSRSASEIPHAWSMIEVDVTSLASYRDRIKDDFRQREGVALTYLPFAIKALVEALKENPLLNSSWGGDKIILKKRTNIGIAVAAPGGLVVPVIHNADGHSIAGLARAAHELTERARQGRLSLEDVQGGTFTLNNTGALGSVVSQPIINHPQAGILTIEAVQKRPVVMNDAIAIRSMMNVCLSFDHRVADGSESSAFLQAVKQRLEAMGPDTPIY
jgi:2-oxoisovalerate dehydrogenase E2 component (dihydrolipoyl transacylase)